MHGLVVENEREIVRDVKRGLEAQGYRDVYIHKPRHKIDDAHEVNRIHAVRGVSYWLPYHETEY
jgi:hypothetical protein